MLRSSTILVLFLGGFVAVVLCQAPEDDLVLDYPTAERLAALPLECYNLEYPHKYGLTFSNTGELRPPSEIHPVFHGCFDWHSSVHGHWLLASVLNKFPDEALAATIVALFDEQFQPEKISAELSVFEGENASFERTYGWAWLLKLQEELLKNPMDEIRGWSRNLQPLVDHLVMSYKSFLPTLVYPIRAGEHTNTAFGLIFAHDYALTVNDQDLAELIAHNVSGHFSGDFACPLSWEPSGNDFLSPCLQEGELVGRVGGEQEQQQFLTWLQAFLPQLFEEEIPLEPGLSYNLVVV